MEHNKNYRHDTSYIIMYCDAFKVMHVINTTVSVPGVSKVYPPLNNVPVMIQFCSLPNAIGLFGVGHKP